MSRDPSYDDVSNHYYAATKSTKSMNNKENKGTQRQKRPSRLNSCASYDSNVS